MYEFNVVVFVNGFQAHVNDAGRILYQPKIPLTVAHQYMHTRT